MTGNRTKGEMHGCIVCGRLYELYVVYAPDGHLVGAKVMSAGGRLVPDARRPLVACEHHTEDEVERAVRRVYGDREAEED